MMYEYDKKQNFKFNAAAGSPHHEKEGTASFAAPPFSVTSEPISFEKEGASDLEKQTSTENGNEPILKTLQKKHNAYRPKKKEIAPYQFPTQKKNMREFKETASFQLKKSTTPAQKTVQLQQAKPPQLKEAAFVNAAKKYLSGKEKSLGASIASAEKKVQARYAKDEPYLKNNKLPKAYKDLSEKDKKAITLGDFIVRELKNHLESLRKGRNIPKLELQLEKVKKLNLFYSGHSFSNDSLTLGSVIRNEAGASPPASKQAVGYAYLNRTGGAVREPKGNAEISHYQKLTARFAGFTNDGQKLTFLSHLVDSIKTGDSVLADKNREANDPTKGATHWISPKASVFDKKRGGNTHERTINGDKRFVPEWARANDDPDLKKLKTGRNASLNDNFAEIIPENVDDFLFYKGVKYKK